MGDRTLPDGPQWFQVGATQLTPGHVLQAEGTRPWHSRLPCLALPLRARPPECPSPFSVGVGPITAHYSHIALLSRPSSCAAPAERQRGRLERCAGQLHAVGRGWRALEGIKYSTCGGGVVVCAVSCYYGWCLWPAGNEWWQYASCAPGPGPGPGPVPGWPPTPLEDSLCRLLCACTPCTVVPST